MALRVDDYAFFGKSMRSEYEALLQAGIFNKKEN